MAPSLVSSLPRKATLPSPPPLPPRRASLWQPRGPATPEPSHSRGYSDEMERIIDRCTSPTPYSHPSTRPSHLFLLRTSGNLRLQSNSSTTLSCTKQSSIHTRENLFMRALRRLVSCISSRYHDDLDARTSHKKIGSDLSACHLSSIPDNEMHEKNSGEYEEIHLARVRTEWPSPVSLTRLATIEERDEEHL